ncbi:MAG: PD-(D/E)XK nuclease family protein [Chloroflexota bacterium]
MKIPFDIDEAGQPFETVDAVLLRLGRLGGPSRHGWHTREAGWRCPRAAAYIAAGSSIPPVGEAALIGSVVHEYLAGYYLSCSDLPARPTRADHADQVERIHEALLEAGHEKVAEEARRLYSAYVVRYGRDGEDSYLRFGDVVSVEGEFRRDLPWGEPYTGRVDLLVSGDGGTLVVDHKVTGRKDRRFLWGWRVSPQMLGLQWMGRGLWKGPIQASINGIIRTKEIEFNRRDVSHDDSTVKDWVRMMHYRHVEREVAKAAGSPPDFMACFAGWQMCPFIDACAYGEEPGGVVERYEPDEEVD